MPIICLDSNIVIYIAQGKLSESIVDRGRSFVNSSILRIEALGFPQLRSIEERRIREFLATIVEIPLSQTIVELAISLRQQKRMSLGDAITAATAIDCKSELWTANEKDFAHIKDLRVHNPLKK